MNADDGTRSFMVWTDEPTLKEFIDKEDTNGVSFNSTTLKFKSFADALTALGQHPWHKLYPRFVHQNFRVPF